MISVHIQNKTFLNLPFLATRTLQSTDEVMTI